MAYHWRARSFQEIIVTQRLTPVTVDGGWMIEADSRLPEGFVLEPLAEKRFGAKLQRVSRVIDIRPPVADAEASGEAEKDKLSVVMRTAPATIPDHAPGKP